MLGEMGGEVVDSCSDSVILLKLILYGSLSSGVGCPRRVPEDDRCLPLFGLMPGDFNG